MRLSIVVLCYIFCCIDCKSEQNVRLLSPLIFVPGCGGNQLEAQLSKPSAVHFWCWQNSDDFYRIWLDSAQIIPGLIDCWVDNMKLSYDNVTHTTNNSPGVKIRAPGWGSVDGMEFIDPTPVVDVYDYGYYFYHIITALTANGYDRQKNMYGAPYDFRKGPNENKGWFQQVQHLTESAYKNNDRQRVTFIAHSMGGLMVLQFLQQMTSAWKETYVKQMITLSVPWGGSIQALQAVSVGYDFNSPILINSKMKEVQETCPSLVWLLPSTYFWKPNEILVSTKNKQYRMENLGEFFNAINNPYINDIRRDLSIFNNFSAPGVEVHCLYGKNMGDTAESLDFYNGLNSYPTITYGDGDGTVNLRSLLGCTYWRNTSAQEKHSVYQQAFPNVEHYNLLGDSRVINYIINRLITSADGAAKWYQKSHPINNMIRFF
ncbi:Phospholipase A2 group XV [Pseudolycoriella hygida]|uniref:Phospholipase A2 group XV n=1 Tax=Pseudolycoriella hygida TaxID=35572 RepID=A0A9Q0RWB3_9DIPT|nr:Phospholipase A2 group XV [Pseudolycoriella hygida]